MSLAAVGVHERALAVVGARVRVGTNRLQRADERANRVDIGAARPRGVAANITSDCR